jgi:hypothetical protein
MFLRGVPYSLAQIVIFGAFRKNFGILLVIFVDNFLAGEASSDSDAIPRPHFTLSRCS